VCDLEHTNKWTFGQCGKITCPMRSQSFTSYQGGNQFEDAKFGELLTSGFGSYSPVSGGRVFYHVTTVGYCHDILKTGVRLARSDDHKDFFDKQGFYVHLSYDGAKEFIGTREEFFENAAIIRFEVDLDIFSGREIKGDEWFRVIPACRKWCPDEADLKILGKYAKLDYLEGPIARLTDGDYEYKQIFPHTYNQLCVRSDILADEFSEHITGVIFFFTIIRNPKSNSLPVYTQFYASGHARTIIRNYKGPPGPIVNMIRKVVGVETYITVRIGKIEIRGNWERQLKYFFEKLGF